MCACMRAIITRYWKFSDSTYRINYLIPNYYNFCQFQFVSVPEVPILLPECLKLLVIFLIFREMRKALDDPFRCGFKLHKGHLPICKGEVKEGINSLILNPSLLLRPR